MDPTVAESSPAMLDPTLLVPVLLGMLGLVVSVAYVLGAWAFAEVVEDDIVLGEPDRTVARFAVGLWWPLFGFFRICEWAARRWRKKSWP